MDFTLRSRPNAGSSIICRVPFVNRSAHVGHDTAACVHQILKQYRLGRCPSTQCPAWEQDCQQRLNRYPAANHTTHLPTDGKAMVDGKPERPRCVPVWQAHGIEDASDEVLD